MDESDFVRIVLYGLAIPSQKGPIKGTKNEKNIQQTHLARLV
jgi:hypothetical protein